MIFCIFAALAWRQHVFVDRYAVNILFWDQWDFYLPLFQNGSLWDIFDRQHGPHRQGLGLLLTSILAWTSGWNARWDAFGVSFVLMAAAALGLLLARQCGARGPGLIVVPLLFFNIRQYESFVGASNISHGAMPIFLFMGLCLAWFIRSEGWRVSCIGLLTFLLIFTGFGLFVGLLVPPLLMVQAILHFRHNEKASAFINMLAILGIGASWALFAWGYHFDPAVEGFRFPYEKPLEYIYFAASMLNNFHGVRGYGFLSMGLGLLTIVFLVYLAIWYGWLLLCRNFQEQKRSVVIFCLAAFVLIYCFETAIGRVFLGWKDASAASRYVVLMIPAGLAIYLHFSGLKNRVFSNGFCFVYAVFLLVGTLRLHNSDWRSIHSFSQGRLAWKTAYLATRDTGKAGELANFLVYPDMMQLTERLQFLEKKQLNLFNNKALP